MNRTLSLIAALLLLPLLARGKEGVRVSWIQAERAITPTTPLPAQLRTDTLLQAWRGERLTAAAMIQGPADELLRVRLSAKQGAARVWENAAQFMGFVLTDRFNTCGYHPEGLPPYRVADRIGGEEELTLGAQQTHPLWCTLEVPRTCRPGRYQWQLEVVGCRTGRVLARAAMHVQVGSHTLPQPSDYAFHLDFWQQPYSVARYYGVPRWSQRHFDLLKPYLRLLARAGQKVASAILFYEPWGEQSHDKFDAMIQTTRQPDGTWTYDYSVFDHWVELLDSCGIDGQINCFSMVPWDMTFRYRDAFSGRDIDLKCTTGSDTYRQLWTPFLRAFAQHLKDKGWWDKTCIAMDERGLPAMLDAYSVAQEAVPGIKMALAGNRHPELVDKLQDYCIAYGHAFGPEELQARRARGQVSTFYTCCTEQWPNIFTNSQPYEATFLPLYAVANGFDGYLHWSWLNWQDDPLHDSRFRMFGSGDTFCVYPGPCSSVRFEGIIQGVQLTEKVRLLRQEFEASGRTDALQRLDEAMRPFSEGHIQRDAVPAALRQLKALLNS